MSLLYCISFWQNKLWCNKDDNYFELTKYNVYQIPFVVIEAIAYCLSVELMICSNEKCFMKVRNIIKGYVLLWSGI